MSEKRQRIYHVFNAKTNPENFWDNWNFIMVLSPLTTLYGAF